MSEYNLTEQIQLIKSLFKGREDVFAIRWEKGSKNGYMPAYDYDPYMYRLHKNSGGSFSDYKDKAYKPLTDGELEKHLNGEQFIGIYPLLKDNSTWFLAADFDKVNWEKECHTFLKACSDSDIQLREHQNLALRSTDKKDFGVIVAPPGTGKTILGLKIIAEKKQPALIVVHRKQIEEQWIERIQTFLSIPKKEVGKIGQGKSKIGKQVTVAMAQSLVKKLDGDGKQKIEKAFGTIIVDECHHIPAKSYRDTIARYLYGLTATPFRNIVANSYSRFNEKQIYP